MLSSTDAMDSAMMPRHMHTAIKRKKPNQIRFAVLCFFFFLTRADAPRAPCGLLFLFSMISRLLQRPVSYTHLDVYKRQLLGRAARAFSVSNLKLGTNAANVMELAIAFFSEKTRPLS